MKLEPRGNFCFLKIRTNPNKLFPYPVGPLVHCAKNVLLIFQLTCKYGEDLNFSLLSSPFKQLKENKNKTKLLQNHNSFLTCVTLERESVQTTEFQNWTVSEPELRLEGPNWEPLLTELVSKFF